MSVSATRPVASHPRLAELALALGGFAIGTTEFVIMGLMNRIAGDLSVSPQQVGYAISSYALGVVVGAPPTARPSSSRRPRAPTAPASPSRRRRRRRRATHCW